MKFSCVYGVTSRIKSRNRADKTQGSAVLSPLWSLIFTALGMAGAFVNWYIADQQTTAVIVVFFTIPMIYFYFRIKSPGF